MNPIDASNIDSVVHVIQLSLSPIFLLTAVATLLNVFTTRLARISDQVKAVVQTAKPDDLIRDETIVRLSFLRRRTRALDAAVILAAVSGASTCGTVLTLFFGALRDRTTVGLLLLLFGGGILCTLLSLGAFLAEVLMASRGIRAVANKGIERIDW